MLVFSVYAEEVRVIDPKSSAGEEFVVGVMEEGGKFYHDRVYTMTGIPKQYLELTNITTSVDTVGDLDLQWTFKIDQSAYVYIGFDERWIPRRTESKIQKNDLVTDSLKPENPWFYTLPIPQRTTGYTNPTTLILQGNVTLDGIPQGGGDGMYRVIFVEADKLAVSSPLGKLAARWGEIKSFK